MIKFAFAGSLNYKQKIDYLSVNGFIPSLVIDGVNNNILSFEENFLEN